jgi:hypothetical protein
VNSIVIPGSRKQRTDWKSLTMTSGSLKAFRY